MRIKTLQWNIGGGKIRLPDANPELDASYNLDGIPHIVDVIKKVDPDIITLQEAHSNRECIQASVISQQVGLPYFVNDEYDDSHIESGQRLGQAIISRFPMTNHQFQFFYNPHFTLVQPERGVWESHDKGVTSCMVSFTMGMDSVVQTLHLIPFKRFKVDLASEEAMAILDDVAVKTKVVAHRQLLQGDFNLDVARLSEFIPRMFVDTFRREVTQNEATTPSGRKYDHIVYRGITVEKSFVDNSALTDHYPLITQLVI